MTYVDEYGNEFDNVLIRKLYWILRMNVTDKIQKEVEESADKSLENRIMQIKLEDMILKPRLDYSGNRHSILHCLLLDNKNLPMIALLLKVLKLSEEVRLSDLLGTFMCFKKALAFESTEINNFISEAFLHRPECE